MFPAVYCVGVTDCVSFATRPRHVITYSDVFVDVGRRLRACFDTQLVFCHHFRPQQVRRRSETVAGVFPINLRLAVVESNCLDPTLQSISTLLS